MRLVLILVVLSYHTVQARIVHVPKDAEAIQDGINLATDHDTILVAPGLYHGESNINLDPHGVNMVIMSEKGPEVTIIDCGGQNQNIPIHGFWIHSGEDSSTVIQGFKIVNSFTLATFEKEWRVGGGIFVNGNNYDPPSAANILGNVFVDEYGIISGAITCINPGPMRIADNLIIDCSVSIQILRSPIVIEGNMFRNNEKARLLSIMPNSEDNVLHIVRGNLFFGNPEKKGWGVFIQSDGEATATLFFERNIFYELGLAGLGIHEACGNLSARTINCDFVRCAVAIDGILGGADVEVRNCIFWENRINVSRVGDNIHFCNINDESITGQNGNFDSDPEFIDIENENFHLQRDSPCIDTGDPDSPRDQDGSRADVGATLFTP